MKKFLAITVISLLIGLSSCAGVVGIQNPDGTSLTPEEYFNRYEHIIQLGVQVGVINLLETNPKYANRVDKFSKYMLDYIQENDMVTLEELEEVARERINWTKFDATERLLVEALITTVRTELENVLYANGVQIPNAPEKVKLYGTKVLSWVGQAARVFKAQSQRRVPVPKLP